MDNFVTEYVDLQLKNGIVEGIYLAAEIDLHVAQEIVKARLTFTGGKDYPVLADTRKVVKVNKEARDFLASAPAVKGIIAAAVYTDSAFTKFMANFFMRITSTPIPTRLFTNKEEAYKWLKKYKQALPKP